MRGVARLALWLMILATIAGCGNGRAPGSQTGSSSTSATGTQVAAPGEQAGEQGTASQRPARKVTLMLNWIPYGEHAPFYYGLEKGFYRAEGIELTIQPGGGSVKTIQAVASKQVDFGWADTPALIKAVEAGFPVKSVGVFLQKGPTAIQFFADRSIESPADLKGKSIAVTPGDAPSQTLPAFLAANGLTSTDVRLVNVDPAGKIAALIEGKADAIIGFFHDQAPTIEYQANRPVSVLLYADYGVNLLSNGVVVHTDLLKQDPGLVRGFLRATIKSWQEAVRDVEGAVAAMTKRAEKAPPAAVLRKQFEKTITLLNTQATAGKPPGINAESDWEATIELLHKYADLRNPGKPSDYWDGTLAAQVAQ